MSIAAITIFCNESFRIPKWQEYYQEYKECISLHIIIDNNSSSMESDIVKQAFPNSVYIKLPKNGGVTAAYNAGVNFALGNQNIDAIMLICNDIKISNESIALLYDELQKNKQIGLVTPVLLKKDSTIIEDGGSSISYFLFMKPRHFGDNYLNIQGQTHYVKSVTGGINIGSREFYERIGPMDERLFMYSDEIDIGLKACRENLKLEIVWKAIAWHQHENSSGRTSRSPVSSYLMYRNKVYLARKYYGKSRCFLTFLFFILEENAKLIKRVILKQDKESVLYSLKGAVDGFKNKMGYPCL